jgi:hypothetical protein
MPSEGREWQLGKGCMWDQSQEGSSKIAQIQSAGEKAVEKTVASLPWKTLCVFHFPTASAAASSVLFFTVVYETPVGPD